MATKSPESSNDAIEELLDSRLCELEDELKADVIAIDAPVYRGFDDLTRQVVKHRFGKRRSRKPRLAFFLQTTGGYIEVVQRSVDVLRKHYRHVEFFVPNFAMSAGTVLVLSGDRIWMDYYSVLGPIDPQVENKDGSLVPALGYIEQYERFVKKATDGTMNSAELAFFIEKFDPAELYSYEQARSLSITLLKEWLVKYKFKNWRKTKTKKRVVTPAIRRQRAEDIAAKLNDTKTWHSHGRGISMEVLRRKLKLQIDDFRSKARLADLVTGYWNLFQDYKTRLGAGGAVHTKNHYKSLSLGRG